MLMEEGLEKISAYTEMWIKKSFSCFGRIFYFWHGISF